MYIYIYIYLAKIHIRNSSVATFQNLHSFGWLLHKFFTVGPTSLVCLKTRFLKYQNIWYSPVIQESATTRIFHPWTSPIFAHFSATRQAIFSPLFFIRKKKITRVSTVVHLRGGFRTSTEVMKPFFVHRRRREREKGSRTHAKIIAKGRETRPLAPLLFYLPFKGISFLKRLMR